MLSETYYGQINIRFSPLQENAEKPIYFWVHQGPKGLHKRCIIISSSFVSAKINARYCCCSRVKAWWMITWASFRAWGTDLKRSSGSLSTGKRSLVSSTVKGGIIFSVILNQLKQKIVHAWRVKWLQAWLNLYTAGQNILAMHNTWVFRDHLRYSVPT